MVFGLWGQAVLRLEAAGVWGFSRLRLQSKDPALGDFTAPRSYLGNSVSAPRTGVLACPKWKYSLTLSR